MAPKEGRVAGDGAAAAVSPSMSDKAVTNSE